MMSTRNSIRFSTYKGSFGFKVPYLLEIGFPYEENYTVIYYTVGNSIFYANSIINVSYNLTNGVAINPHNLYNLSSGSKSNVSIVKEILKLAVLERKSKRTYKVGTLSRDFGFEFVITTISSSRCSVTVSVSDGSKFYVTLSLYSLVDIMRLQESDARKQLLLKLLDNNFPDKESLMDCTEQLYNLITNGVSNVNK